MLVINITFTIQKLRPSYNELFFFVVVIDVFWNIRIRPIAVKRYNTGNNLRYAYY